MTVFVYVSKQVGDPEHVKVFASVGLYRGERTPKPWPLSTRFKK
jgi:hypothetical protein